MITIYHNPRCSKSREGVALLEKAKVKFKIIKYLDAPPTAAELKEIIQKLEIKPIELVRTKEAIWKENFKGKELSDAAIINAMATYPKLIERPIVINGNKAALGRPVDLISEIL